MRINYNHIRWILPAFFIAYIVVAYLLMQLLNADLPQYIEIPIFILIAPVFIIFRPLYPLLNSLGLMEGEWWRSPSFGGLVLSTTIYAVLLYVIGTLIALAVRYLKVS